MTPPAVQWLAQPCPLPASDSGWLTQPVATVLAACIAIVAATTAYLGVLKTTSTTRRENRRAEKVEVLTAAHVAMQDYVRTIQQLGTTPHEYRTVLLTYLGEGRINEILAAVSVSYGKLYLYGFHDASKLGAALIAQLKVAWGAVVSDPSIELPLAPIDDTYKAWLGAISGAFDKLK